MCWLLNSAVFNSFHNRVDSGTILEGLWNFGGGVEHSKLLPPRYATELRKAYTTNESKKFYFMDVGLKTRVAGSPRLMAFIVVGW